MPDDEEPDDEVDLPPGALALMDQLQAACYEIADQFVIRPLREQERS